MAIITITKPQCVESALESHHLNKKRSFSLSCLFQQPVVSLSSASLHNNLSYSKSKSRPWCYFSFQNDMRAPAKSNPVQMGLMFVIMTAQKQDVFYCIVAFKSSHGKMRCK